MSGLSLHVAGPAALIPRRPGPFPAIPAGQVPDTARSEWLTADRCPDFDCRVEPGDVHKCRCEQQPCPACGTQRIRCERHNDPDMPSMWHGVDPEMHQAAELGWWMGCPDLGPVPDFTAVRAAVDAGYLAWDPEMQRYEVAR